MEQTQRFNTALAAATLSSNVLLGTLFMQPPVDCRLQIAAALPALAGTNGLVQATLRVGGRVVLLDAVVPTEQVTGQGPSPQVGILWSGVVLAGELVEYFLRNTAPATAVAAPGVTSLVTIEG